MRSIIKTLMYSVVLMAIVSLSSCSTSMPVARQSGVDNAAYLLFTSAKENVKKHLSVNIDGSINFEAQAIKDSDKHSSGTSYKLKPGTRHITVKKGDKVLFNKTVFINPQETKIIQLP